MLSLVVSLKGLIELLGVLVLAQGCVRGTWDRGTWSKRLVTQASFATEEQPANADNTRKRSVCE